MNCARVQDLLPLYLSGELRGEELAAMELHFQTCELCRKTLSSDRELDNDLRKAMREDTPDVAVVLRRVQDGMTRSRWKSVMHPGSVRAVAVVAAIVLIAFIGVSRIRVHQMQKAIALDAANDHYSDLILLRHSDWTEKPADVARFMEEQFPQRPELLARITPSGASFEKVRFCNFGGIRYAHFVFKSGTLETSVFLAPASRERSKSQTFHLAEAEHGLEVSEFSSSDVTGMVVGNMGSAPTREIADRLARTL
jgi:anti-sigma factor RsiW